MQFNNEGLTLVIILFGLTIIGLKIAINYYAPVYKNKKNTKKALKSLFGRLTVYLVLYALSITLTLVSIHDASLRLLVLLFLTFSAVGRCIHMVCSYGPQLEAWGREHVK